MLRFSIALSLMLASGTAMAASAWTGGDDLPTHPLACDATPAAAAAMPYNGGATTGAPDRKGKPLNIVDIPKLIGIGYFNATSKGHRRRPPRTSANVTVKTDGPTQGQYRRPDHPSSTITSPAASTGSCSPPNDPVAIAPVLKKALSKGIMVVGYDADAQPDARQWFGQRGAAQRRSPRR